jgi:hypothetical protein
MIRVWVAFVLFVPFTVVASDTKEPTTEELIAQLGHKTFTVREKAMVALRARGPSALPAMKKAFTGPDADSRTRKGVGVDPHKSHAQRQAANGPANR